ncbi:MAG: hypothetical protein ACPGQD_02285 [Planctomycetota bacterium]
MRHIFTSTALGLLALTPLSCGSGGGGGGATVGAGATAAGQGTADIVFSGVASADAINSNEVTLSWPDAVLQPTLQGAAGMRYRIYRGLDEAGALNEGNLVATTEGGVTSFVDSGLPDNTTLFYRVVAVDTDDRLSLSNKVASARTPAQYGPGLATFGADILPLWSTPMPGNPSVTCLTCHTTPGPGSLDLSTVEGLLVGIGTSANPDTFVVPYDGASSWSEFIARMSALPTLFDHLPYFATPDGLLAMEEPLSAWIFEGALTAPDSSPPVFTFSDPQLAGLYFGEFTAFDTVQVTFPHASDPESLPANGSRAGQLEYAIYAGRDSNSIAWDQPIAISTVDANEADDDFLTETFTWTESDSLVVVVRPLDSSGRSVPFDFDAFDPATASADTLEAYRQRMRNQSPNEREMIIIR